MQKNLSPPPCVIAINIVSPTTIEKMRFNIDGTLFSKVTHILDGDNIVRQFSNNKCVTVNLDGSWISIFRQGRLTHVPIPKYVGGEETYILNTNIGVIDTETYDNGSKPKVYALGLRTSLDENPTTFYIGKETLNSTDLVCKLVDEMLRPKYSDTRFYCHNFSGFDSIFIINALFNHNEVCGENIYRLVPIFRKNKVLRLTIYKSIDGKRYKTSISDGLTLLNKGLAELAKSFEVQTQKGIFPYAFATKDNLFYKGSFPGIECFNGISQESYNIIKKEPYCFQSHTEEYLKADLNSLYEVVQKANRQFFRDFKVSMPNSLTISALALKIFIKKKNITLKIYLL